MEFPDYFLFCILIKISQIFVHNGSIDDKLLL